MKIAIGCDHVGFILKDEIINFLKEKKYDVIDCGTNSNTRVDYPVYSKEVAKLVTTKKVEYGILICGTGVGISIVANKIKGIRAVVCSEPYSASLSKKHNNTNILAFGSRVVGAEIAKMIVEEWLNSEFEGGRHQGRIEMYE